MLQSLQLGNQSFPINLIQGPLAGVSSAPFRVLTWQHSQPAFSCTEMLSCKTIIHQPELAAKRFIAKAAEEGPLCVQLAGNQPADLAEAVKRVTDYGADLIDLNCGCPVKKIRHKGYGSKLLMHPLALYHLIISMKQNTHLPVSIKIRVEGSGEDKFNQEIAKVVTEAGADFLIVHGRQWTENYETPCRYEDIQYFVEQLKIPVIGNGDVSCLASLKKMFTTGCAGIMIGRASVGRPWLIKKLIAEFNQQQFAAPSLPMIATIFQDHIWRLSQLLGSEKFAILQARKIAKYYAEDLLNIAEFCQALNQCTKLTDFNQLCQHYFV